jgi:hypothetical protein
MLKAAKVEAVLEGEVEGRAHGVDGVVVVAEGERRPGLQPVLARMRIWVAYWSNFGRFGDSCASRTLSRVIDSNP